MNKEFSALVVRRSRDRDGFTRSIETRSIDELPKGELLVRVHYSSLNYKDGLSCAGNPGVTRRFPHTPGIDAAGIVEESTNNRFEEGSSVVVAGTALGMAVAGGFGQYIRIPAHWAVKLPKGMDLRDSMILGTAGFTAALSVYKLLAYGVTPKNGSILVTGASGGVGCVSVALLAKLGFSATAVSGKSAAKNFLMNLGAQEVLGRDALSDSSELPLLQERWAGGIDTVGGLMLANAIKSMKSGAAVAATGLVASKELPISVLPFILRGVSLLGINAEGCSMNLREEIWAKLASEWRPANLSSIASECSLNELSPKIDQILLGQVQGRLVVDMR